MYMDETTRKRIWFVVAASFTAIAAILYCSWPLGFWLNPTVSKDGLASELGAHGQPYNWLFIGSDVTSGILLAAASLLLLKILKTDYWEKVCLIALAVYAICGAIDAALPLQCLPSLQVCGPVLQNPVLILHGIVDITGSVALIVTLFAAWQSIRRIHRNWTLWIYIIGIGGIVFAALSGLFILFHGPGYWAQRYYLTLSCIWVATVPFVLVKKHATLTELNN